MTFRGRSAVVLLAGLAFLSPPVGATDRAHEWLVKINEAARRLSYDGTFVYLHGRQADTLRIVHRVDEGGTRERLVSLSGAPREILRSDQVVHCYLPEESSTAVEHVKAGGRSFPALLPERVHGLDENYLIGLGRQGRVAGRLAQLVTIMPRDAYRYGYQLWADTDSGLLLRAELLNERGEALEQFMFTHVTVGKVPASALEPEYARPGKARQRAAGDAAPAPGAGGWVVNEAPKGFTLSLRTSRTLPMRTAAAEHLVFTDGLATVSLFIEKVSGPSTPTVQGANHMGAVHAYGRRVGDYQVTAVGEVPAATVVMMANAVAPAR